MRSDVETRRYQNDTPEFDVSGGSNSTATEASTEDVPGTLSETGKYGNAWFFLFLILCV